MIQEDMKIFGTTESTETTERRIRRRETRPRRMRSTSAKLTQGIKRSWIGMHASDAPTWNSLRDLCALCGWRCSCFGSVSLPHRTLSGGFLALCRLIEEIRSACTHETSVSLERASRLLSLQGR